MSHDDLTDDTDTTFPWHWLPLIALFAVVAWFATDGGEGSMPEPLPCDPAACQGVGE